MRTAQWVARDFTPDSSGYWISYVDPKTSGLDLAAAAKQVFGWFTMENYTGSSELSERIRAVPAVWDGSTTVPFTSERASRLHADKSEMKRWFDQMSSGSMVTNRARVIEQYYPGLDPPL